MDATVESKTPREGRPVVILSEDQKTKLIKIPVFRRAWEAYLADQGRVAVEDDERRERVAEMVNIRDRFLRRMQEQGIVDADYKPQGHGFSVEGAPPPEEGSPLPSSSQENKVVKEVDPSTFPNVFFHLDDTGSGEIRLQFARDAKHPNGNRKVVCDSFVIREDVEEDVLRAYGQRINDYLVGHKVVAWTKAELDGLANLLLGFLGMPPTDRRKICHASLSDKAPGGRWLPAPQHSNMRELFANLHGIPSEPGSARASLRVADVFSTHKEAGKVDQTKMIYPKAPDAAVLVVAWRVISENSQKALSGKSIAPLVRAEDVSDER